MDHGLRFCPFCGHEGLDAEELIAECEEVVEFDIYCFSCGRSADISFFAE